MPTLEPADSTGIVQDMPRVRAWIERFTTSRKIQLSPQQQQAVEKAAYSPVMVIKRNYFAISQAPYRLDRVEHQ